MGIHLMPPLFQQIIAPQPTDDYQDLALLPLGFEQYWGANSQTFQPAASYTAREIWLMLQQLGVDRRGKVRVKLEKDESP